MTPHRLLLAIIALAPAARLDGQVPPRTLLTRMTWSWQMEDTTRSSLHWGGTVITLQRTASILFTTREVDVASGNLEPPRTIDSLAVAIAPWERVIPTCRATGSLFGEIVGLVVDSAGAPLRTRKAWRLVPATRHLVPLDSLAVHCYAEGRDGD